MDTARCRRRTTSFGYLCQNIVGADIYRSHRGSDFRICMLNVRKCVSMWVGFVENGILLIPRTSTSTYVFLTRTRNPFSRKERLAFL